MVSMSSTPILVLVALCMKETCYNSLTTIIVAYVGSSKRLTAPIETRYVIDNYIKGEIPELLAREKVLAVIKSLPVGQEIPWVLGADTIVSYNNKIYGKPENQEQAFLSHICYMDVRIPISIYV